MTTAAAAEGAAQPETFAFTKENLDRAKQIIARYPDGRQQSAVMPLLDLAQRQSGNWLPRAAMDHVAEMLEMPKIRVYEVASFYTMYNKAPVAKYLVQICRTTPCWLCGCNDIARAVKDVTGAGLGETVGDFTVIEVECLGACVNAPMVQINDDYYEDLNYDRMVALLEALKRGETPTIGSQTGRRGSEAASGPTTMLKQRPKPAAPAAGGRAEGDKG